MNRYKFDIKTNRAGQRVLIVDDYFRFDNYETVGYEDFDAVLYTTNHQSLLEMQFIWLNPLINNSFLFKPFFFSPSVTRTMLKSLCDGLYQSENEIGLIEEVIRIQNRMNELRFRVTPRSADFWSHNNINIAILRLLLSRNEQMPRPLLKEGSAFGYIIPILELMFKHKYLTPKSYDEFIKGFINNLGYLEKLDLINIVHVCPECYMSHLIYSETCPSCGSVDIIQEDMIHHFRCANISSESSYMRGGKLTCPKCSHDIKHIGVDYDRPTGVYLCRKCNLQFTQSTMSCTCTACGKVSPVEGLVPHEIFNSYFTPLGKKILSQSDEYIFSDDVPLFDNIFSVNDFKTIVKTKISVINNIKNKNIFARIYRVRGNYSYEMLNRIIDEGYAFRPEMIIAFKQSTVYAFIISDEKDPESAITKGADILLKMTGSESEIDYLEYNSLLSAEEFISQL